MTMAGRTFVLDRSEKGYCVRTTSFFEQLGIDLVLGVVPDRIQ